MVASMLAPALLLLASAVAGQDTPSVVTSVSISPVPTTEGPFTIQTSVPGTLTTTPCYEVCIMEPCPVCSTTLPSDSLMSIPPGETPEPTSVGPILTNPLRSSVTGNLSTPPGVTPEPTSIASIITDPLLSSATGNLSIPAGETPLSTGSLDTPAPSRSSQRPNATSSAPPQQTTNAASPAMNGVGVSFVVALAGVAFALL
ncbi:uncharacterized protein K460DRAFT_416133 [Cucurbitaria berberidis CBS 394.84]|uniref:Uncharacterized protein n=1 Tax=Cucurbitaria berberidis CBS 394.84 TaxID=1168544 RepID=A0A9P4GEV8_9PLEO|nr:uncharacterized protein K460DRAFT_416133 [Cucurbitaria berberidis CBS 394.84]KAF1844753.1 hypothetical protein K460DRAFT_416133 [Cucurbitaria berberidis CBS 394.84]